MASMTFCLMLRQTFSGLRYLLWRVQSDVTELNWTDMV